MILQGLRKQLYMEISADSAFNAQLELTIFMDLKSLHVPH